MSATEQVAQEAANDGDAQTSDSDVDVEADVVDLEDMSLLDAARKDAVKLGIIMLGVGYKLYNTLRHGTVKTRAALATGVSAVGAAIVTSATAIATALMVGFVAFTIAAVVLRVYKR